MFQSCCCVSITVVCLKAVKCHVSIRQGPVSPVSKLLCQHCQHQRLVPKIIVFSRRSLLHHCIPVQPLISCQDQAHVFAVCCAAVVCFLTHILAFLLFSRYVIIKCFSSLYLSSKKQVVLASIMMMSPAFDLFRL